MLPPRSAVRGLLTLAASFALWLPGPFAAIAGARALFIESAVEHSDNTVTLPLFRGTSQGREVWFVILDASDGELADALGVNRAQKLENARGTRAVQRVRLVGGVLDFPATVDFGPEHHVVPGPAGFPPAVAEPGAVGEPRYSPLVQLPDGTILNAPHVANDTGQADKVVHIDKWGGRVTYRETLGFMGGRQVRYVSTDSSDAAAAALEESTWAPLLAEAPAAGEDGTDSARASLAAFVNGQTGASNPARQGLNSALLDHLDPLNVLFWNPKQGRYSPLWDVFPAAWSPRAIENGRNVRQTDFGQIIGLVDHGLASFVGNPDFGGAADIVVNCPIVSRD